MTNCLRLAEKGRSVLRPYRSKVKPKKEQPKTQVENRYLGHPNPKEKQTQEQV